MRKIVSMAYVLFLLLNGNANAQYCPPNLDFENGTTSDWLYFTGTCCPIVATTPTTAIPNRHTLTSGTGVDPHGGFPIVSPGGGSYSLRVGNDSGTAQSERARYYVHVPSTGSYSLIYRYAVVMESPGHVTSQQPRVQVTAFDSATVAILPCSQTTFTNPSTASGYIMGTGITSVPVFYKPWTKARLNLDGYAGRTVVVDFASGDCGFGGHFAYGYFDMSCGLYADTMSTCPTGTITLTAPSGDTTYHWYDSATFSTSYGTTASITIPAPTVPTTYAVISTPYYGYGCPDTQYTHVTIRTVGCPATGVTSTGFAPAFSVFPNPGNGNLNIQLSSYTDDYASVTISKMTGELVKESRIKTNSNNQLQVPGPSGIYIISVTAGQHRYVEKLTIVK